MNANEENGKKRKDSDTSSDEQNFEKKIEIVSAEDERLKIIGEILSSETSRTILKLLISCELSTHEIIQKTGISLSLVLHHVNKMLDAKLVGIVRITKSSKGQDMKHYKAKQGVLILPEVPSQKAKSSKMFQKSLVKILRFCSIGVAGMVSWFAMQSIQIKPIRPIPPPSQLPPEVILGELFWPVVVSLTVIIVGLIAERVLHAVKK